MEKTEFAFKDVIKDLRIKGLKYCNKMALFLVHRLSVFVVVFVFFRCTFSHQ